MLMLDLFPFQEEGAVFLTSRDRLCLFDEMGVGKTAQAIRALDMIGARHVIVVCPAAVRDVWLGEFRKFEHTRRRILKGKDIHDLNLFLKGKIDVLLLSYEMATKWARRLEVDILDAVIFDEAHYLKTHDSQRTRALLGTACDGRSGLGRLGARAWFLTGTPNANDAADIWSLMRFCRGTALSREAFCNRYYFRRQTARTSHHTPRGEKLDELKQVVASCSIRRMKRQVGLQLPPIFLTTTSVAGDTDEINQLLRQHPGLDDAILEALDRGGLAFIEAQHIATLRRLVAEAKAPAFLELLTEELNNGLEQVVVFGIHRRALDILSMGLHQRGISSVRIDGSTSDLARRQSVEKFQAGDARVFLGNIRAAGTGLTLHAAADVIMFESDWSPAGNAQALMRVHRIGQERAVRARFISLANSIDETVEDIVARKTAAIAMIEGRQEYAA
jgi:SWI/SNF-related matrix-associated actin-dependent regulator 1 of chromatin subfamily A